MNEKLTREQRDWKKEAEAWMKVNELAIEWNESDIEEVIEIMRGLLTAHTEPEDEWVYDGKEPLPAGYKYTEDEVNKGVYIPPYNIAEDECNHENAAHNFQSCPDCGKSLQPHTAEDKKEYTLRKIEEYVKDQTTFLQTPTETLIRKKGLFTYYRWLVQQEDKQPPCINCGQTEGDIYQGQPHDHVCADCGREIPYNQGGE